MPITQRAEPALPAQSGEAMPEHLRSLVVVLLLAAPIFFLVGPVIYRQTPYSADFARRRNAWFAVTLIAFLSHNYWIFIVLTTAVIAFAVAKEQNRLAFFFLLVFAMPALPADIPGFGVMNHFFTINYVRLLTLLVLLPTYLSLRRQPGIEPFGHLLADKLVAGYIALQFLLMLEASTFTNVLRHGAFYSFIDVFLPYYVASRCLRSGDRFRDAAASFVVAGLILSAIGTFEFAKHWLLYSKLDDALGVRWGYGNYLERDQVLRALATTGQPIALGYAVAVAMGLYLFIQKSVSSQAIRVAGWVLLVAGLIAPVSRGPWLGAALMVLIFAITGPRSIAALAKIVTGGLLVFGALMLSPVGEQIIELLPFVGTVDEHNITYRKQFTEISIKFVLQHPLFGAYDYIYAPEMDVLKPQGLLDTLNVFLAVALGSGLTGLLLFAGVFVVSLTAIRRGMEDARRAGGEYFHLGRVLFCTLLGIILIICTVSAITIIPVVYWSIAGLGVAYGRMLKSDLSRQRQHPSSIEPSGSLQRHEVAGSSAVAR